MGSDGRGVDNSVDGWATDYLLFCAMFMFACRLFFLKHCSAESALTQLFQSGGYLFGALGHHVFPNRAFDSPCGDHYFYWVWIAAYTCQGLSCICWLKRADRCTSTRAWRWTRIPMANWASPSCRWAPSTSRSAWCLSPRGRARGHQQVPLLQLRRGGAAHEDERRGLGCAAPAASERFDLCGKQPLCDAVVQYARPSSTSPGDSSNVACRVGIFLHDHYERVFAPGTARVFEGMWMNFNVSASRCTTCCSS